VIRPYKSLPQSDIIQRTDLAMQSSDVDVMMKRQNTLRYLQHVRGIDLKGMAAWNEKRPAWMEKFAQLSEKPGGPAV
jgi:hypothetical protein